VEALGVDTREVMLYRREDREEREKERSFRCGEEDEVDHEREKTRRRQE